MEEMKVSKIILGCENTEDLTFDITDFTYLIIGGITKKYQKPYSNDTLYQVKVASSIDFELKKSANTMDKRDIDFRKVNSDSPFLRIVNHLDICNISVVHVNGYRELILVPWGGDKYYTNDFMSYRFERDGNLQINIAEINDDCDHMWLKYDTENRPYTFKEWKKYKRGVRRYV